MKHDEKPLCEEAPPPEVIEALNRMMNSSYSRELKKRAREIRGKTVVSSIGGKTGYILQLADDSIALCFLDKGVLKLKVCKGSVIGKQLRIINSPKHGDASSPLSVDLPYANENCDLSAEIQKCHGKEITGLAVGERSFNICFPGGMELDAMIVPDATGKESLRVFWEQW